jgi:hypothetical protein
MPGYRGAKRKRPVKRTAAPNNKPTATAETSLAPALYDLSIDPVDSPAGSPSAVDQGALKCESRANSSNHFCGRHHLHPLHRRHPPCPRRLLSLRSVTFPARAGALSPSPTPRRAHASSRRPLSSRSKSTTSRRRQVPYSQLGGPGNLPPIPQSPPRIGYWAGWRCDNKAWMTGWQKCGGPAVVHFN